MYSIEKPIPPQSVKVRSTMPTGGPNELLLPAFLKPNQATKILNYFLRSETELYKRGGIRQMKRVASIVRPTVWREWTETLAIIGYGTTLAAFNFNDDTINTIKSNFSANLTGGVRYGQDFYSCNGKYGDKIYKTTLPTITYGTQTANFTVGQVVTQAVTGATGKIISDTDAGATGTLALDNITGVFNATNIITDPLGGSATATSLLTWTNTAEISATAGTVPKCEALSVFDKSLVAVSTNNNQSEVLLSKQNLFTNWDTTAAAVGSAFSIVYSFAGEAVCAANFQSNQSGVQSYGNVLVTGFKSGYAGFERSSQDIGGTTTQVFPTVFEKINDGMEQNALSTPQGIFFANENGIFLLLANTNGERIELTRNIKRSRKANFNFTDVDFAWSSLDNRLYVSLRENSDVNNLILWFDTRDLRKNLIWGEIPYPVGGMFSKGDKIYGVASTSPRVLEMFAEGQLDDEGGAIDCLYRQPLNTGALENTKDWLQLDLGADISPTAPLTAKVFGVLEEGGEPVETGIEYTISSEGSNSTESELGVAELGVDGFVGTPPASAPVWTPFTGYEKVYGYNSYELEISSSDKLKNVIRYVTATIREGRPQRKNVNS